MAFYGDVTPGEAFKPSAALSNDIRHLLNGLNGFGGNPFGANGAGTVRPFRKCLMSLDNAALGLNSSPGVTSP